MINKLISLVIITFFLTIGHSYSENQFLFPKKKPSVFSESKNNIDLNKWKNLPQQKPVIEEKQTEKKDSNQEEQEEKEVKKMET